MIVWLVVIATIVVAMTILVLLRKSKVRTVENFQNASGSMGWAEYNARQGTGSATAVAAQNAASSNGAPNFAAFLSALGAAPTDNNVPATLLSASTNYGNSQLNYATNVVNKEVLTNKNMPDYSNSMNTSVNLADVYLGTPEKILVKNLQTDNNSQFTDADLQFCKSAIMPANLPPHLKGAVVGCGWYYVPDLKLSSSGALGQPSGPTFPDTVSNMGNGQWIWDLAYAQQLEEIKNCRRITQCSSIDAPSVSGKCGFCAPSGYAVPAHTDGSEKYPDNPNATCNEPLAMNSGQCPKPPPLPLVTPAGLNCGTYGRPSSDYALRLYTSTECVDSLHGKWDQTTNECFSLTDGSSISQSCSGLNGAAPAVATNICTPDTNGKLSRECLISLAKSVGYTVKGAILQLLQTAGSPSEMDGLAMQIVKGQNIPVNPTLYQGGAILPADAITAYDNIYNLIKGGTGKEVQEAAKWLCIGSNDFDPCDLPDTTPGPFFPQCVQQAWRIAGCQPAGTQYPSQPETLNQLNSLSWGAVKTQFQNLYNSMSGAKDAVDQDINVLRCLGISTQRAVPKPCIGINTTGLIINLDQSYFNDNMNQSNYKSSGVWPSSGGAKFNGNFVVNGTRVCDGKGIILDGTAVAASSNITAMVTTPPPSAAELPPPFQTGFLPIGDVGMGVYSTEYHYIQPSFIINIDRSGWQPYMTSMISQIANGKKLIMTVVGNNSKIKYSFPLTNISLGGNPPWNATFSNPAASKPTAILFVQDSALSFSVSYDMPVQFDTSKPIWAFQGVFKDIGFPGEPGIGLAGDGKTYWGLASTGATTQWQYGDRSSLQEFYDDINKAIKAGTKIIATVKTTSNSTKKPLTWSSPITGVGAGGWFTNFSGSGPSPLMPNGGYYVRTDLGRGYGLNSAAFADWDDTGGAAVQVTIGVPTNSAETRELWIKPSIETCEILAVFEGSSYSQTYTALGIYQSQLVCALKSVEKGYTFFNCGSIVIGQWSHIVHVYDNGNNLIYINGMGPVGMALTRVTPGGYNGFSLGGGSQMNPFYQNTPAPVPFQGQIGAFRLYNRALTLADVQTNLASTLPNFIDAAELATKNDGNAKAMKAGNFYVPMLGNALNYSK